MSDIMTGIFNCQSDVVFLRKLHTRRDVIIVRRINCIDWVVSEVAGRIRCCRSVVWQRYGTAGLDERVHVPYWVLLSPGRLGAGES